MRQLSGKFQVLVLFFATCQLKYHLAAEYPASDPKFLAFQKTLSAYFLLPCDVVLLLDESTSLRAHNFDTEVKLAESVARLFRVGANDTRFSVVTFSTSNRVHFNYIGSADGQLCNFLSGMKNVDYKGGWTFTKDALFTAQSLLKQGRQYSKKIIILIVDGRSNEADPVSLAKQMKANGIIIFSIGIGPYADVYELKSIASSSLHFYMIKDFNHVPSVSYSFQKDIDNHFFVPVHHDYCPLDAYRRDTQCLDNAICACTPDGNYACACKIGYESIDGFTNCTECPVGTVKDTIGWGTCLACPENSSTLKPGSGTLSDCKCNPGFYGNPVSGIGCKSKYCKKLFSPFGGDLIPANCGNAINDECSFFCNVPYCPTNSSVPDCIENHAGVRQHSRVCSPSGEWTGEEFGCKKATCQPLTPVVGGHYECDDESSVGSRCQLLCDDDYELFGGTGMRTCLPGESWKTTNGTCREIISCYADFCVNGGSCYMSSEGSANCSCPDGFGGVYCEITLDVCNTLSCLNNGNCSSDYTCSCAPGYTGQNCEINVDDCIEDSCINGGTCLDGINDYQCICPNGAQGKSCEVISRSCDSSPCQNGGRCLNKLDGFSCCCPTGYFGEHCEITADDCRGNTCQNSGVCMFNVDGSYSCLCLPGYWGAFCENTHPCDPSLCENGGTCLGIIGNQSCTCPAGFTGIGCELELLTDFDLVFEPVSVSNYVSARYDVDLHAITVSFWMRSLSTVDEQRGTPISISYRSPATGAVVSNGLTWYNFQKFKIYLHGKPLQTNIVGTRDRDWHHYAFTWDASTGNWAAYKDGVQASAGMKVGVGVPLWKGIIVIGQEQDFVGGGFQLLEAFRGEISQVNVWDFSMNKGGIESLAKSCGQHGNILDWARAKEFMHGFIRVRDDGTLCEVVGFCRNSTIGCTCEQNQNCVDSRSLCSSHLCKNGGICKPTHTACTCPPGYLGTHCQFDINECLIDNGNCSHSCINTIGSYECQCRSGFFLSNDTRTCTPKKYCNYKGVFYSDRQQWKEGCDRCQCIKGLVKCLPSKCPSPSNCLQNEHWGKLPGECCGYCQPANASCLVNRLAEYITFDGFRYKFSGVCRYVLVKDCSDSSVEITLEIGNRNSFRKLMVTVGCSSVEILPTGQILVDGSVTHSPYVNNNEFNIYPTYKPYLVNGNGKNYSPTYSLTIVTNQGIMILWKAKGIIQVDVPFHMRKRLCGLCGNFNGLSNDDLMTSNFLPAETFSQFVLSWQVGGNDRCDNSLMDNVPGRPLPDFTAGSCALSNPKRELALRHCQPLRDAPFHPCYAFVNPKKYYELCMQDSCSCNDDNHRCHCNAMNAYMVECENFNITVTKWQGMQSCASHCQSDMIFSTCGPPCPRTCDPSFNDPRCQIQACKIGCHCPNNLVLRNGHCIDPSEC